MTSSSVRATDELIFAIPRRREKIAQVCVFQLLMASADEEDGCGAGSIDVLIFARRRHQQQQQQCRRGESPERRRRRDWCRESAMGGVSAAGPAWPLAGRVACEINNDVPLTATAAAAAAISRWR